MKTTVLMPTFNNDATIGASVESVLAQTVSDFELIVVDDASEVPVAEVLEHIRDPRLRLFRHRRNRRTSAALNTGLAAVRTPLISRLDADDVWEPAYLETVLPLFEDTRIGLAYTNSTIVGHPRGRDVYIADPAPHPLDTFPEFAWRNPIPALTVTMRCCAVRHAGGWATWLPHAQDYELYARLIAAGWRFAYVHRALACYRWPEPGRGQSYDLRGVELDELKLWTRFALRHPLTPGPKRRIASLLKREAKRRTIGLPPSPDR